MQRTKIEIRLVQMYLKITWIFSGCLFLYNKLDHKHDE